MIFVQQVSAVLATTLAFRYAPIYGQCQTETYNTNMQKYILKRFLKLFLRQFTAG